MGNKRYRINGDVLRFEDDMYTLSDYLTVPKGVSSIDFNNLRFILKPLVLSNTKIKQIDFKNVISVQEVIFPDGIHIKENLYYAKKFIFRGFRSYESARMVHLGLYSAIQRPLLYLSGSVVGNLKEGTLNYFKKNDWERNVLTNWLGKKLEDITYLELRACQRAVILYETEYKRISLAVYSPGNHMTVGDNVADEYPKLVFDIDVAMLDKAEVILFDLTNLSPGTSAELGYCLAKINTEPYKSKRMYYIYEPTKNFFINGLLSKLCKVSSLEEMFKLEEEHKKWSLKRI